VGSVELKISENLTKRLISQSEFH